jgi:hypothetical protein
MSRIRARLLTRLVQLDCVRKDDRPVNSFGDVRLAKLLTARSQVRRRSRPSPPPPVGTRKTRSHDAEAGCVKSATPKQACIVTKRVPSGEGWNTIVSSTRLRNFGRNSFRRAPSTRGRRQAGRRQRTLKSKRGRSFPIHQELLPTLRQLPRHADGYVFHGPRGGQIKPDTLRNILIKEVLKPLAERFPTAAGEAGFVSGRLHSFRHFFCSLSANSGVPERVVMDWLGHADAAMVRRYYHLNAEESRRQMDPVSIQSVNADPQVIGGDVVAEEAPDRESA